MSHLIDDLKELQKIVCSTCEAGDYETCQNCRLHQTINKILNEPKPISIPRPEAEVHVVLPYLQENTNQPRRRR
jgi:hypothetical protein